VQNQAVNPDLQQVIDQTNDNRATFEAFCRSLLPDELQAVIPGLTWRVQDYIAHLATIDIFVADWFEHHAAGKRWRPTLDDGSPFNIDTWNEARIQERRDASVEELLVEAAVHRARLWAAVRGWGEEQLAATFNFRGREITHLRYLQLWTAHDPAHTLDMLRGLPPERRDGAMDAWLKRHGM
jgi:hypothetical protein